MGNAIRQIVENEEAYVTLNLNGEEVAVGVTLEHELVEGSLEGIWWRKNIK